MRVAESPNIDLGSRSRLGLGRSHSCPVDFVHFFEGGLVPETTGLLRNGDKGDKIVASSSFRLPLVSAAFPQPSESICSDPGEMSALFEELEQDKHFYKTSEPLQLLAHEKNVKAGRWTFPRSASQEYLEPQPARSDHPNISSIAEEPKAGVHFPEATKSFPGVAVLADARLRAFWKRDKRLVRSLGISGSHRLKVRSHKAPSEKIHVKEPYKQSPPVHLYNEKSSHTPNDQKTPSEQAANYAVDPHALHIALLRLQNDRREEKPQPIVQLQSEPYPLVATYIEALPSSIGAFEHHQHKPVSEVPTLSQELPAPKAPVIEYNNAIPQAPQAEVRANPETKARTKPTDEGALLGPLLITLAGIGGLILVAVLVYKNAVQASILEKAAATHAYREKLLGEISHPMEGYPIRRAALGPALGSALLSARNLRG